MPKAAILTIGTELLLGKIVDTNGAYLGEVLSFAGFDVAIRLSIGDHRGEIRRWIQDLLDEVDLIVTTGGLGPTKDDLTRQEVAEALGVPLVFHEELLREIEGIFASRGFHMTENNRRQAYLPEGAQAISNPVGTAPAFFCKTDTGRMVVCLPGVPRELKYLTEKKVLSMLREEFHLGGRVKRTRVLKICGLGESGVDQQIGDLMKTEGNPFVGVLASPGMIRVLITAEGGGETEVREKIAGVEKEIRRRLGKLIFGVDDQTLEGVVAERLSNMKAGLLIKDGATGGELARRLLKEARGSYRLEGAIDFSGKGRIDEKETESIYLEVVEMPEKTEEGLGVFEITLKRDGEEKRSKLRLGGPREMVETRLAIIAIDQLRKWLEG